MSEKILFLFSLLVSFIPSSLSVVLAAVLLLNDKEYWGWFIFLAIVFKPKKVYFTPGTEEEKADNKNLHPIQPLVLDENGVLRFEENKIVRYLLDAGPFDMNKLALMPFSNEDREQFAQLIGYSLSGFSELSYVSDETYNRALDSFEK